MGFAVGVIGERALALHQAERARAAVLERAFLQMLGVVQRPPDLFAGAVEQRQAVGIVHGRAEVVDAAAVGVVEVVHAGQRRDAGAIQRHARIQAQGGVEGRVHAGGNHEAHRAGGAGAVEQRVHDDGARVLRRPLDPERHERREFLIAAGAGVQRQTARRQAVQQVARHRAEIAGAEERADFVEILRAVDRRMHAETGEAQVGVRGRARRLAEIEQFAAIAQRRGAPGLDQIQFDPLLEQERAVEQLQLERQAVVLPHRLRGVEADVAPAVVIDLAQARRQFGRRRAVRLGRQRARQRRHGAGVEGLHRPGRCRLRERRRPGAARGPGGQRQAQSGFDQFASVQAGPLSVVARLRAMRLHLNGGDCRDRLVNEAEAARSPTMPRRA